MVNLISKFLAKLNHKQRKVVDDIIVDILDSKVELYDIKKMAGRENIFRIRKGNIRIIYIKLDTVNKILYIGNRDENTYKKY